MTLYQLNMVKHDFRVTMKIEMRNFLDIIHLSLIKKHTRRFGDWSLSPSSGKYVYMLYFSSLYSMTWPPLLSGDMD
jgi:hypothetical protein